MNVAIVTIFDHYNLGNRLQNFSVQKLLNLRNINAFTIYFMPSKISKLDYLKAKIHNLFSFKTTKNVLYWKLIVPREKLFRKFNRKYLKTIKISNLLNNDSALIDYWIVGSDQVWNIESYVFPEIEKKMYFLTFVDKEKKISLSASFGIEKFSDNWKSWLSKQFLSFKSISVREESGARIIKALSGVEAQVLIDPTLMFDADDWLKISKKVKNVDTDRQYILTYFLGEIDSLTKKEIDEISKVNGLAVYNLLDESQPELYVTGPEEFIHLVSKASLILTDSFHACVFSFIFKKPFVVYKRNGDNKDMSSRMDTFLTMFDLERKRKNNFITNELFEAEYQNGYTTLAKEREKFNIYLDEALGLVE